MGSFNDYLSSLNADDRSALENIITLVRKNFPDAKEGLSYGLPAFKYNDRPLTGFSSNKYGLNLYPFDPKILEALRSELADFECGKGVIRFSVQHQLPEKLIITLVAMRLEHLKVDKR